MEGAIHLQVPFQHSELKTPIELQEISEVLELKSLVLQMSPALLTRSAKRRSVSPRSRMSADVQTDNRCLDSNICSLISILTRFLEALVSHPLSHLGLVQCRHLDSTSTVTVAQSVQMHPHYRTTCYQLFLPRCGLNQIGLN